MIPSVTKAVNSVNADSAMLGKIIYSQQRSSAEKLLERIEEELNKVYDENMWVKIENKPFYYCKEGGLYVVDPSRYKCSYSSSSNFPSSVENVPTTYPLYD
ncbi:MAG: hypothetical protein K2F73_05330, partial [Ruminococcus sp.]|nr:hypothetical protein [Ruminococcus sp.]